MQTECREHTVYVGGEVTVNTVTAPLYRNYCRQLAALGNEVRVDFSGVVKADSACLSLLAVALRCGEKNGAAVSFHRLPAAVTLLAELYEVDDWIRT
ncbi:lipid asymmetry maintenance protein MlaB [Neisseria shayeganii]|uniref:NTP binding protein containing STAS domain protein n=1 Tax=Neisseria shayeganii 871 TaxID=1032488 RepID=G4CEL7_9NEIS|nr:STAS domain-containing protein [Neisseria shayeganii]EGY53745.1 NTP binding protein containing STAS domain protein [Neisseria shayeganii 871]